MENAFDFKGRQAVLSETGWGFYVFIAVLLLAAVAWVGFEIQIRRIKARERARQEERERDTPDDER